MEKETINRIRGIVQLRLNELVTEGRYVDPTGGREDNFVAGRKSAFLDVMTMLGVLETNDSSSVSQLEYEWQFAYVDHKLSDPFRPRTA